jgi:LPXTG-motif cell wall-anchored protein
MVGTRAARLVSIGACAAGLCVAVAGPAEAQQDPPGNNGTVKIDGVDFDDHPNNEPHVGCEFQVDFYGFDQGDLEATVLFEAIPPTVDDAVPPGAGQELVTDELAIGEDAAGGGVDLDASGTYDLTDALAGIEPHPQQGWHVQLTVHAEGSQGADTKYKVFWVTGCGPTTTTSTTTPGSTTTTAPGSTTTTEPESTTTTPGGTAPPTSGPPNGVSPTVPDSMVPVGASAGAGDDLPQTGSNSLPLVAGALALIAVGTGLVAARHLRLRAEP